MNKHVGATVLAAAALILTPVTAASAHNLDLFQGKDHGWVSDHHARGHIADHECDGHNARLEYQYTRKATGDLLHTDHVTDHNDCRPGGNATDLPRRTVYIRVCEEFRCTLWQYR